MKTHPVTHSPVARTCALCGSAGTGRYCGNCGAALQDAPTPWQDGVYLGTHRAQFVRVAPHELRELIPLLFAPFRHLDAIPTARWRATLLIAGVSIVPLASLNLFVALNDPVDAYRAYGLYFSALWALLFAAAFRTTGIHWRLGLLAYFGTMVVGMAALTISLLSGLEALRGPFVGSHAIGVAIPGSILFIGVPEELCKALVLFVIWRYAKDARLRAFVFYGILSGLGFGIKEGLGYQLGDYAAAAARHNFGFITYYLESVLRLTSLPFFHAVWTGIAAFLLWFAQHVEKDRNGLIVLAIAIPATLHGLYDALSDPYPGLALIAVAVAVGIFGIYVASAARFERALGLPVDDDDDVVPSAAPAVTAGASVPPAPSSA